MSLAWFFTSCAKRHQTPLGFHVRFSELLSPAFTEAICNAECVGVAWFVSAASKPSSIWGGGVLCPELISWGATVCLLLFLPPGRNPWEHSSVTAPESRSCRGTSIKVCFLMGGIVLLCRNRTPKEFYQLFYRNI